jgi:hypothetical protein
MYVHFQALNFFITDALIYVSTDCLINIKIMVYSFFKIMATFIHYLLTYLNTKWLWVHFIMKQYLKMGFNFINMNQ